MNDFLDNVELSRVDARNFIAEEKKKLSEQYFTPYKISLLMARMFSRRRGKDVLKVLDPCCGVGNLAAALHQVASSRSENQIFTLIESDEFLAAYAVSNFKDFSHVEVGCTDFFKFFNSSDKFDRIIINPPYSKIKAGSLVAKLSKKYLGYSDSNLYSAFVACCVYMLAPGGEVVAIIPRSFCNGPFFKGFRNYLLNNCFITELYLFDSRKIFSDSQVVQEILVIKLAKRLSKTVKISHENLDGTVISFNSSIDKIVFPHDSARVIHIPCALDDDRLLEKISRFTSTLSTLGFKASTGKIVDFRMTDRLRFDRNSCSVYMVYQDAIKSGDFVDCNKSERVGKPRFFHVTTESEHLLIPKSNYILVRRISFKEADTRISAAPLLETQFGEDSGFAIDNHLNYIWRPGGELSKSICIALAAYLCTDTVDLYVRRFSGHTQINAADLNSLPVPSIAQLEQFFELNRERSLSHLIELAELNFFSDGSLAP